MKKKQFIDNTNKYPLPIIPNVALQMSLWFTIFHSACCNWWYSLLVSQWEWFSLWVERSETRAHPHFPDTTYCLCVWGCHGLADPAAWTWKNEFQMHWHKVRERIASVATCTCIPLHYFLITSDTLEKCQDLHLVNEDTQWSALWALQYAKWPLSANKCITRIARAPVMVSPVLECSRLWVISSPSTCNRKCQFCRS